MRISIVTGVVLVAAVTVGELLLSTAQAQTRIPPGLGDLEAAAAAALANRPAPINLPGPTGQLPTSATEVDASVAPQEYAPVESDRYGQWLFRGEFAKQSFIQFNPDYVLGPGDRVDLRFWGGFDFAAVLDVDSQGRMFVPRLGPIAVAGVRNGDLNKVLKSQLRRVFREEVGVYASLANAEPVKVFVGGNVERPGLYGASASDSLLHFLDRAGGVSPEAGSYRYVEVKRAGRSIAVVDLYQFLHQGEMPLIQLRDGDTIFVAPAKNLVTVQGMVAWERRFEMLPEESLQALLALAQVRGEATHVRVTRRAGAQVESFVYELSADLAAVNVAAGDEIDVYADRPDGTIVVRITGEHQGHSQVILPYGASLADALIKVQSTPLSNLNQVQLYRRSLAERQGEVIEQMLRKLEESVLTARSNTREEASLRAQEAQLILQFVERAQQVEPKGQVVLRDDAQLDRIILEASDEIRIPRNSQLVSVYGEVYLPASFSWSRKSSILDYIDLAGGFTQGGAQDRVLVMKPSGAVQFAKTGGWFGRSSVSPGDEILVLPRIDQKRFQLSKDIVEVVYQIAVAAGVLVRI
nr:SLBB domain-containing protein [Oceanococcus sp. HetDA_MAG_MS8]